MGAYRGVAALQGGGTSGLVSCSVCCGAGAAGLCGGRGDVHGRAVGILRARKARPAVRNKPACS